MDKVVFTKDDISLLITALSKYLAGASLEPSVDVGNDVYAYIKEHSYECFISHVSHAFDLQKRLIEILNNF